MQRAPHKAEESAAGPLNIAFRLLLGAAVLWALGNLLGEQNLPGAVYIEHAVFTVVVSVFLWLTEGDWVLPLTAGIALVVGVSAFVLRRRAPWLWKAYAWAVALVVLTGQVGVIFFGALMEKELTVALLAGIACWAAWGRLDRRLVPLSQKDPRAWQVATIGTLGAVSLYYLYSILNTNPSGYHLLQWAARLFGSNPQAGVMANNLYIAVVGAATLVLITLFFRRPQAGRRLARTLAAWVVAAVVLGVYARFFQRPILFPSTLLSAAFALLAVDGLTSWGFSPLPDFRLDPRRYPKRLVFLCLFALLAMLHTYSFRVFHCERHPALTHLADVPEVFRAVLDEAGENLFLVLRPRNQIVKFSLAERQAIPVNPGPLRDMKKSDEIAFWGTPEDLIYVASRDRLLATFYPYPDLKEALLRGTGGRLEDIVVAIDPQRAQVADVYPFTDLCWINSIRWNDRLEYLYVGCEDRERLLGFDPDTGRFFRDQPTPDIGDIQDLIVDNRYSPQRLYIISLWYNAHLTELNEADWRVRRRLFIGGANYDAALAPQVDRLFVGRFYESRVTVVDLDSFQVDGILRTGLGTRALAVDESRGLLLVSSIYDGVLRAFDVRTLELRGRLQVGGHVKSIALDTQRGLAYFAGQQGLFRLDLDAWLGSARP
ncbi:MAG: hypothetical protein P9L99_10915 [Candidatus Lernaella stagnicola]|nr:hypothetical protein [Candidatus Lernaella stagnicola]